MSSVASPYGLRPINLIGGQVFAGSTRMFPIASGYNTRISYGDIVAQLSDGTIGRASGTTAVAAIVGVFLGVQYTSPGLQYFLTSQFYPAGLVAADTLAFVADDPDTLFQIQSAGSIGLASRGENVAIVNTASTLASGNSLIAAGTTPATTATLPLRIIDFVRAPGSVPGDAFTDIIVKWNFGMHVYNQALGI